MRKTILFILFIMLGQGCYGGKIEVKLPFMVEKNDTSVYTDSMVIKPMDTLYISAKGTQIEIKRDNQYKHITLLYEKNQPSMRDNEFFIENKSMVILPGGTFLNIEGHDSKISLTNAINTSAHFDNSHVALTSTCENVTLTLKHSSLDMMLPSICSFTMEPENGAEKLSSFTINRDAHIYKMHVDSATFVFKNDN